MELRTGLGDINKQLTERLYASLRQANIYPWFTKLPRNISRGAAVVFRYDPTLTVFRVLANSPRFFEASLRSGLLSNDVAALLTRRLVEVCTTLLAKYNGFYAPTLKNGRVGEIVARAQRADNAILAEAYHDLFPDELYAALPWPCLPGRQFIQGVFSTYEIDEAEFMRAANSPFDALTVAVDQVTLGPSLGIPIPEILRLLDCLEGRGLARKVRKKQRTDSIHRIIIPAFGNGLHGLTLGLFANLDLQQQLIVANRLQQVTTTIEEFYAHERRQQAATALRVASTLGEVANAVLLVMPPIASLHLRSERDTFSYTLQMEDEYCAGYAPGAPPTPPPWASGTEPTCEIIVAGRRIEIFVVPLESYPDLDAVMTTLRMHSNLRLPPFVTNPVETSCTPGEKHLSLRDLLIVRTSLERQITQKRGAQVACRNLYLVDLAERYHADGEAVIYNQGARSFMQERLKECRGYQVCGKALKKYEIHINRLLPGRFRFEPMTETSVKVLWTPAAEEWR
jgi:hypothetical protein